MKSWIWRGAIALPIATMLSLGPGRTTASPSASQAPELSPRDDRDDADEDKLPNGKSRKNAILKAEYDRNLRDAARLVELSGQLKQELEKGNRFVLSMATLKKTDEIEKLAKSLGARMRHN